MELNNLIYKKKYLKYKQKYSELKNQIGGDCTFFLKNDQKVGF